MICNCALVFLMLNKDSLFSDFLWLIHIKCTLYIVCTARGLGYTLLIDENRQIDTFKL